MQMNSAKAKQLTAALKDGFAQNSNPTAFLVRNALLYLFDTTYQPKSKFVHLQLIQYLNNR